MQTRSSTHVPHAQWTFYVLPSLPRAHNTSQHINQPRAIGQGGLRTPQGAPALTFVSVWTSCAVCARTSKTDQNTDVKPHTRQSGAIVARQCICQVRLMQYQYACLTAARETHVMPPTAAQHRSHRMCWSHTICPIPDIDGWRGARTLLPCCGSRCCARGGLRCVCVALAR
jgi:hypothetical protein